MDDHKFKGMEEEVKALNNESLDQAAGGTTYQKEVCRNCGSSNTIATTSITVSNFFFVFILLILITQ